MTIVEAERQAALGLAEVAELFESATMGEAYGEDVSIRDHMLQSAELAVAQRLGDALVIAALLHDIGWGMGDGAHEQIAADLLEPLFGAAVAEPIRLHVAAKRYLVGTRPEYFAVLSAASRATLVRQGGPMAAAECAAFTAHPAGAAALQLRGIDDAGKTLTGAATGFADYAPLLQRYMMQHLLMAGQPGLSQRSR